MTTKEKSRQILSEVEALALPPRRSARHQSQTLPTGSSSRPITIPDSPPLLLNCNAKDNATTNIEKENELIQVIPKLEFMGTRHARQIEGINQDKDLIKLIQDKQAKLLKAASQIHGLVEYVGVEEAGWEKLKGAVDATLVFAQEEAGTAICISGNGLILTCAHCVAESTEELDMEKVWILLFSSGQIVQAKTVHWDEKRDLALLRIIGAQANPFCSTTAPTQLRGETFKEPPSCFTFPYVRLAESAPKTNAKLLCIGHPGSEDLETSVAGVATGYDVLHVSQGRFKGYARGQDRQDNSEIGALKHDCWTYWGHSGAPLVEMASERKARSRTGISDERDGRLVGLHSSWDEETGMRRGVGWEALRAFLEEGVISKKTGVVADIPSIG